MDRDALLLYLQNVRDLEVARYWLRMQYRQEKQEYEERRAALHRTDYLTRPERPKGFGRLCWVCAVIALVCLFLGIGAAMLAGAIGRGSGWIAGGCLSGGLIFGGFASALYCAAKRKQTRYDNERDKVERHNLNEHERERRNRFELVTLESYWVSRALWYKQEFEKQDTLLKRFYDMNLIPAQFCTVSAVCWIYDYMAASEKSLTAALSEQLIEDGIRRLEAKLDTIISNLETIVYETRCIRENSERSIAQNSSMLDALRRTESNALVAAQYAELSANYSKANAYFSLATYLKK